MSEDELWEELEGLTVVNVPTACGILSDPGISIPLNKETQETTIYKISGYLQIGSPGKDDADAMRYLKTNGPLIAVYTDEIAGDHCVAIIGYTDDNKWICKDSYPSGRYNEIGFENTRGV